MKILYAIQGTGNGHISRAKEVAPVLEKRAHVDYLVSGCQLDLPLPFKARYRCRGVSLIFGKNGGVHIGKTIRQTTGMRLHKEVRDLPVENYDLVINDFEPVSAWAARRKGVRCVGLSHQSALLSRKVPRSEMNAPIGKAVLQHYAPADSHYGFHFDRYDNDIFTPIIRNDLRQMEITDKGHYTVYLPAYGDERLIQFLSQVPDAKWDVFTKHGKNSFTHRNVHIQPINGEKFAESMASSSGVLCGGGFETPSEAIYLGKKLMVVPMRNQYEQQCNAKALEDMGIQVIYRLNEDVLPQIRKWVESGGRIKKDYPDETEQIVDLLLENEL
jgi:uncharacterized protein (TIGR00661 family)